MPTACASSAARTSRRRAVQRGDRRGDLRAGFVELRRRRLAHGFQPPGFRREQFAADLTRLLLLLGQAREFGAKPWVREAGRPAPPARSAACNAFSASDAPRPGLAHRRFLLAQDSLADLQETGNLALLVLGGMELLDLRGETFSSAPVKFGFVTPEQTTGFPPCARG